MIGSSWVARGQKSDAAAIVVGGGALFVGLLLLVLPGPGIPFIVMGMGVLSVRFHAARRFRRRVIHSFGRMRRPRRRRVLAATIEPSAAE